MIAAAMERLAYLKYLFRPGAWRWLVRRLDALVVDHIQPWSVLRQPEGCQIHPTVSFRHPASIRLGRFVRIQNHCCLWASPNSLITVGDYSGLGPGTMLYSSNHKYEPGVPYVKQPWVEKSIDIGSNVWVGAGCIILPGVKIGNDSVIAAGSVVVKDVPAGSLMGGVPARSLKDR